MTAPRTLTPVTKPGCYSGGRLLPVENGLYCQRIFGPVSWASAGDPVTGVLEDDRAPWAWIQLPDDARLPVLPVRHRRFLFDRPTQVAGPLDRLMDWHPWPEPGTVLDPTPRHPPHGLPLHEPPINRWYRLVLIDAAAVERLRELGAPAAVHLVDREERLRAAVEGLLDACAALPEDVRERVHVER